MGVYIHINFCNNICSYCDFCKFLYNEKWVKQYLEALKNEITINYKGDIINTLYIGGGTPSCLSLEELKTLFDIINKFNRNKEIEFTFECNIENVNKEKLELLYSNGVNRLSIGVQTFNEKYLKFLNRNHTKEEIINKISLAKSIGFNNINIDLIYAIPGQTLDEVRYDIEELLKLDITHISTYSLIIEPNTKLYIENTNNISEDLDRNMYDSICQILKDNGYIHYEISNFCKEGYQSKHNLTYWNNQNYYGFGLGASGYIKNIRYDNTKSFNNYVSGKYLLNEDVLSKNDILSNEFILGFRKINGINKQDFYNKYKFDILNLETISKLIKEEKLIENQTNIFINSDYIYTSNDILINFLQID